MYKICRSVPAFCCNYIAINDCLLLFNWWHVLFYTGTVLVRPEPVDNGRDDFRGPEFRSRKPGVLRKDFSRRRGGQSVLVDIWIFRIIEPKYCKHKKNSTNDCLLIKDRRKKTPIVSKLSLITILLRERSLPLCTAYSKAFLLNQWCRSWKSVFDGFK